MLTPEIMLRAYTLGLFPMAKNAADPEIYWFEYDPRGVILLDRFHIPARLKRTIRQAPYVIRIDTKFDEVIHRCHDRPRGEPSWLNQTIVDVFIQLHRLGFAHSVEAWKGDEMVGGLYGVALGGAFFGESMFSTKPNASKIALVHLVARLVAGGFQLLDVQESNPHTRQFGVVEISSSDYHERLAIALQAQAHFATGGDEASLLTALLAS